MSLATAPPPEPAASDTADDTPRHTIGEVVARTGLSADTLRWYSTRSKPPVTWHLAEMSWYGAPTLASSLV